MDNLLRFISILFNIEFNLVIKFISFRKLFVKNPERIFKIRFHK